MSQFHVERMPAEDFVEVMAAIRAGRICFCHMVDEAGSFFEMNCPMHAKPVETTLTVSP